MAEITTFSNLRILANKETKVNGFFSPALTQQEIDEIPQDILQNGGMLYNSTVKNVQIRQNDRWGSVSLTRSGSIVLGDIGVIGIPSLPVTGAIKSASSVPSDATHSVITINYIDQGYIPYIVPVIVYNDGESNSIITSVKATISNTQAEIVIEKLQAAAVDCRLRVLIVQPDVS